MQPQTETRTSNPQTYSFRDPNSWVEKVDGVVRRHVTAKAATDLSRFLDSGSYRSLISSGFLVEPLSIGRLDDGGLQLEHVAIDNWNFAYEWSWTMLRDAALAHLEILLAVTADGFTLSDASSFNVTFVGSKPVFIDFGSFVSRSDDEPWWAYTQFCEHFLYPLLVSAYTGAELQPLLRGGFGRVSIDDAYGFLRTHKRRKGVLKHVILPHLAARTVDMSVDDVSSSTAGMTTEIYTKIIEGLHKLVTGLENPMDESTWIDYAARDHYSKTGLAEKDAFIKRVCEAMAPGLVLDMGTNDGRYATIAAAHADKVVAVDADALVVDSFYRSGPPNNVLPMVVEATNPTASMGWRLQERSSFGERVKPDLVLALAVLHHISISGNVPMFQIGAWMADFDADFIVEFVHREDGKVQHLLSRKQAPEDFDYGLDRFIEVTSEWFDVVEQHRLETQDRTMLHLRR